MDRDTMLLRAGFYFGRAMRDLGDSSYAKLWIGKAHLMTEAEFQLMASEIHGRLLAAGKIAADEDPYDEFISASPSKTRAQQQDPT